MDKYTYSVSFDEGKKFYTAHNIAEISTFVMRKFLNNFNDLDCFYDNSLDKMFREHLDEEFDCIKGESYSEYLLCCSTSTYQILKANEIHCSVVYELSELRNEFDFDKRIIEAEAKTWGMVLRIRRN